MKQSPHKAGVIEGTSPHKLYKKYKKLKKFGKKIYEMVTGTPKNNKKMYVKKDGDVVYTKSGYSKDGGKTTGYYQTTDGKVDPTKTISLDKTEFKNIDHINKQINP